MSINDLLLAKGMSKYQLSKTSGIPKTTIIDICSGKTNIKKCSAETLYKLSKALGVTMESLIEPEPQQSGTPHRNTFTLFRSNVCHYLKTRGDIGFIIDTLETDEVRTLYNRQWYPEALYLLAMIDYLARENQIPLCSNYNDIRACRLAEPLYPTGVLLTDAILDTGHAAKTALEQAIPEFLRFNIVESEVRCVV